MEELIIPVLIAVLTGYVLYRRGQLRKVTKIGYVYKDIRHKISISSQEFHGFDYHYFSFERGETVTLAYEVTVEKGSLCLDWRDQKDKIWKKTFTIDEQGT